MHHGAMTLDAAPPALQSEAPLQTILWTLLGATIASLAFELSALLVPGVQENPHLLIRVVALVIVVQPGIMRLKWQWAWLAVLIGLSLAAFQLVHLAFIGAAVQWWALWLLTFLVSGFAAWWMPRRRAETVDE